MITISSFFFLVDDILSDTALVENLETTKCTAAEIQQKVAEAKITSEKIDEAREHYRPAAARASLLYFILNELNTINLVYQFSLKVRPVSRTIRHDDDVTGNGVLTTVCV